MEHLPVLRDLIIVYAAGALVVYLFHKIGQSALVAFLITGLLVGPNMLGLVSDLEVVQILAELGVMLLLFSVGLEFSLRKLLQMRRVVFLTGPAQVLGTVGLTWLLGRIFDLPTPVALVIGFCVALSSTAMVVRILVDRGELDAFYGRCAFGILIFQDLSVVAMIVLLPQIAGPHGNWMEILVNLVGAGGLLVGVFLLARYLYPAILRSIVGIPSKELFVIVSLVLFLGAAWAAAKAGFSLALGAFLAGLVISGSEYSQLVFSEIRPLRDSLNSLFFISIGMLVEPRFLLSHWSMLLILLFALIAGKIVVTATSAVLTGVPTAVALTVGFALAQIGEFSFVLLQSAGDYPGLIPYEWYQALISVAVMSLLLSPFLVKAGRVVSAWPPLAGFSPVAPRSRGLTELATEERTAGDHVIICGFGVSGRNLARVLKANAIPYVILELNVQTVREEQANGEPIFFADCTDVEALERAGVKTARVIVYAVSDPFALRRSVPLARSLNREIVILTRTKWLAEIDELYQLGANEVIAEEFEASIELLARILRVYNLPRELVASEIRRIRQERYSLFRSERATVPRLRLARDLDVYVETCRVSEKSPFLGKAIGQTHLRNLTGALILGIVRGGQAINNPGAHERIRAGDLLVLSGTKEQLRRAVEAVQGLSPFADQSPDQGTAS